MKRPSAAADQVDPVESVCTHARVSMQTLLGVRLGSDVPYLRLGQGQDDLSSCIHCLDPQNASYLIESSGTAELAGLAGRFLLPRCLLSILTNIGSQVPELL